MAYIFLDESGQFTKHNNEKYFIVGSFTTGDPRRTAKRFRSWQREKFPKKMRNQAEIKYSEVNIDDNLRFRTLKAISDLDVRINYTYLLRDNIPEEYRHNGTLKSGHLYTQVVGETLELYAPPNDLEFRVFCDQRHLKGLKRSEYKQLLTTRLLPLLPKKSIIQIEMLDSTKDANIQIADWISGALAQYHECKGNHEEYFNILSQNIINGKELFKEYWQNRYSNKKPNP